MWWDRLLEPLRGKAVTVPPLDGAWKPNTALDQAPVFATLAAPDDLVIAEGRLVVAAGPSLLAFSLAGGEPVELGRFDAPVTALAALPGGGLVVGLDDGSLHFKGGAQDGRALPHLGPERLACPVAIAALSARELLVCQGSARHRPSEWAVDLMEKGASGSLWRLDLDNGTATRLADRLAWPAGVLVEAKRDIVVSEAWRHRLVRVSAEGRGQVTPLLAKLPGYPGRLAATPDGGAWLAVFAPRNRLVEFVLQKDDFRLDMLAEVQRDFWVAPALSSGRSFLEPLQSGGVITMGIRKPWAPSRSYGLVARLDAALRPVSSLHSRADGVRHGVTGVAVREGRLFLAVKGGGLVLDIAEAAP